MGQELSGNDPVPWYGTAVLAGRARDWLDKRLADMRP